MASPVKRAEWNDRVTPRVDFVYDAASRLTGINNANATISRIYWNDNSLKTETETPTGGVERSVTYFYDADGNRDRFSMPDYTFQYQYTWRNQLQNILNYSNGAQLAHYDYDARGNVTARTVYTSPSTQTTYLYDGREIG
jgi:YD repeat-containing protein